jgi:hypothetical protein
VSGPDDVLQALGAHRDLIAGETLALDVVVAGSADEAEVAVERISAE